MGFDEKREELKRTLAQTNTSSRRIQKSFTLKEEVADELTSRAKEADLTASRYLEKLLQEQFNL